MYKLWISRLRLPIFILRYGRVLRQHIVGDLPPCVTADTGQDGTSAPRQRLRNVPCHAKLLGKLEGLHCMKSILNALVVLGLGIAPAKAQDACSRDAMVVFDGSGSMAEMGFNLLDEPRIFDARRAVRTVMPQVAPVRRIGLVTYGFGAEDSCQSVELRFPPEADAAAHVIAEVEARDPGGETPLTEAIAEAARVLDYARKPGEIVLVTDGKETCGGAPCQLAAPVARCLADQTGGLYVQAETLDDLIGALRVTLGCQVLSEVRPAHPARREVL